MDLKKLGQQAKSIVDKRGGTESLKRDTQQLKQIAKGSGSLADKAKAAVEAIKEPGGAGTTEPPAQAPSSPAAEASEPEVERAEEKVDREARGKHAGGGHGRGQGRRHRGQGRRRADEPGV
jgi:hypothetical protein